MPKKKKRLSLNKLTVVSLSEEFQAEVKGGGLYPTYLSDCCTVNMSTCIVFDTYCFRTDTYQPGGTACP